MKSIILSMVFFTYAPYAFSNMFQCEFTEPFSTVYVYGSKKNPVITVVQNGVGKTSKLKETKKEKGKVTFVSQSGQKLEVYFNKAGSDGMSEYSFPYEGVYNDFLYGGCKRHVKLDAWTSVNRYADENYPYGTSMVQGWPGEHANLMGYQFDKFVTLPKTMLWQSVTRKVPSKKDCSFSKGKKLVPVEAKGADFYGEYNAPQKYTAVKENGMGVPVGESVFEVQYFGEGNCLVEKDGKYDDAYCPSFDDGFELDQNSQQSAPDDSMFGNWMFVQCNEGHYTWVQEKNLADVEGLSSYMERP